MLEGAEGGQRSARGALLCTSNGVWNASVTLPCKREFLVFGCGSLSFGHTFLLGGGEGRGGSAEMDMVSIYFLHVCVSESYSKYMIVF